MLDPDVLDRVLQGCSYRFREVVCPTKNKKAKITAAKFSTEDEDWSVIECSLLSNREVDCEMSCLSQESEFER